MLQKREAERGMWEEEREEGEKRRKGTWIRVGDRTVLFDKANNMTFNQDFWSLKDERKH